MSTSLNVHNVEGIRVCELIDLKECGFSRTINLGEQAEIIAFSDRKEDLNVGVPGNHMESVALEGVKDVEVHEVEEKASGLPGFKPVFQRKIEVSYLGGTFTLTLVSKDPKAIVFPEFEGCPECPL